MLDFSSEKEMKIAKSSSVYEGYMRKRLLAENGDEDSRNARENAKARRMSNHRVTLKGVIRAPRGRKPRTSTKETVEIQQELVLAKSPVWIVEKDQVENIKEEGENKKMESEGDVDIVEKAIMLMGENAEDQVENIKEKEKNKMESEGDVDIGEKAIMPMGWNVEECYWPEMPASYEEEWMMSGWEKWVRYDEVMSGVSWVSGVDYTDEEGLVWEDDLWNLRGVHNDPPNP